MDVGEEGSYSGDMCGIIFGGLFVNVSARFFQLNPELRGGVTMDRSVIPHSSLFLRVVLSISKKIVLTFFFWFSTSRIRSFSIFTASCDFPCFIIYCILATLTLSRHIPDSSDLGTIVSIRSEYWQH